MVETASECLDMSGKHRFYCLSDAPKPAHGAHAADAAAHNAAAMHERPLLAGDDARSDGENDARQLRHQCPDRQQAPGHMRST